MTASGRPPRDRPDIRARLTGTSIEPVYAFCRTAAVWLATDKNVTADKFAAEG
jgi:hypothetical protein